MITQGLINLLLTIITPILSLFPEITFSITAVNGSQGVWQICGNAIRSICYFLPMETVLFMFDIMIAMLIIRCIIAFLKTLWAVIPIL